MKWIKRLFWEVRAWWQFRKMKKTIEREDPFIYEDI